MNRALTLICLLAATPALATGVELEARIWSADLAGRISVGNAAAGTPIDLEDDIGLRADEFPDGRFFWRPTRRTSLRLGFTRMSFAGDALLDRTIRFGGSEFRVTLPVASELEIEYGRIGFAWQFLSNSDGSLRLGPVAGLKGFRGDAAITATGLTVLPLTARQRFEVGFASAGLVLDVEATRKLHLAAEWTTLVGSDEGSLDDFEVAVRYYLTRVVALTLGHRSLQIDAEDGGDRLTLDLDGTYFGAVLRF